MTDPIDPLVDDPDDGSEEEAPSSEATRLLRVLEHITEMAGEEPEAEVFLGEVIHEIARSTGAQTAVISLLDPGSETLDVKATVGFGTDTPDGLNYIQDGIHGWILKIRTPMIITDQESRGGLPLLSFERTALVAAPVLVGTSTYGVISIMGAPRETFHETDMLLVSTVASLLGGMIGHRRAQIHAADSIRKAIESLTMALDARDEYTRGHSQRVAMYSLAIANELERAERITFNNEKRNSLLMSALLHDIGKIGIRDEVLLKPGRLTDEEFALIKTHPVKGAEIVRMIPGFNDDVIAGILQHHERVDGKGYPAGTSGDDIHVFGRIIGLADTFDAIVTSRPYKTAASFSFAMTRIEELSGTAFDPEIVRAMLRAMKDQSVWTDLGAISQGGALDPRTPEAETDKVDSADRTLRRIFGKNVNDLPTLPHVVSQILEKTRNTDSSLDEIVSLIATDQALVSTILKLVNSAFYGFSRRITTLKQAITLLGFRSVRNIVVNAGVVGIFRKRTFNNQYRFRLWDHSVACAVAARTLAKPAGYKSKEEAFTAGLLHDIGKVVIDQYAPKDSAAIMKRVDSGMTAREAEAEVVGADHTEIGAMIAERWKLPRSLCWVIQYHHDPDSEKIPGNRDLVRLVAAANGLCRIRPQEDADKVQTALEDYVASAENTIRIDLESARAALPEIWQGKADAMKTFGGARPMEAVETADADETAAAADKPAR